jgi:hypothetical protein
MYVAELAMHCRLMIISIHAYLGSLVMGRSFGCRFPAYIPIMW